MMNMEQVKAEENETEILTMIQQMGKYPDFHEFTHPPLPPSSSSFSHQNPNPIFPQTAFNNFQPAIHHHQPPSSSSQKQNNKNSMAAMREMIYRIAAMQPIHIDPESVKRPKRRNVKISKDPQSVAARLRREKISERIRILQRIVPGGTKMDTASMLDEAIHYVKFLKNQLHSLENAAVNGPVGLGFPVPVSGGSYFSTSLYVSDEEEIGNDD